MQKEMQLHCICWGEQKVFIIKNGQQSNSKNWILKEILQNLLSVEKKRNAKVNIIALYMLG